MTAVRRNKENFCSKLSWPTDWLDICSEIPDWLRRFDILKLGHLRLEIQKKKKNINIHENQIMERSFNAAL